MAGGAFPSGTVDDYGIPSDFNVGAGYGYIPYYEDEQKIRDAMLLGKAGIGSDLLKQLVTMAQDPAGGPAGLAMLGGYGGGAQNIAAGTDGKGVANPYTDKISGLEGSLQDWIQSPGGPFAPGSGGQFDLSKGAQPIDPNKAPAPSPEQAAKGPNTAGDWQRAWEAFNPGKTFGTDKGIDWKPTGGIGTASSVAPGGKPTGMSGFRDGGKTLIGDLGEFVRGASEPEDFVDRIRKVNKVTTALRDLVPTDVQAKTQSDAMNGGNIATGGYADGGQMKLPGAGAMPGTEQPPQDDGGLAAMGQQAGDIARTYGQGAADRYWQRIQGLGRLKEGIGSYLGAGEGDIGPESAFGDKPWESALGDLSGQSGISSDDLRGTLEPFRNEGGQDTNYMLQLLMEKFAPALRERGFMADGGGMKIGGEPHWIVDSQGNKVAALTEDGKDERVEGFGGVEVTPLDPQRRAAYEASKRMSNVIAGAEREIPGAQTGANMLFPDIPGSGVNQSPGTPEGGTTEIPTWGGPNTTRQQQIGDAWKPGIDPTTRMPNTMPTGANWNERYAKLLGSSLAANTAIDPEFERSLNSGRFGRQLPSMQAWNTMLPSQQKGMMALAQQMGLGSTEDIMAQMKGFRPDRMIG